MHISSHRANEKVYSRIGRMAQEQPQNSHWSPSGRGCSGTEAVTAHAGVQGRLSQRAAAEDRGAGGEQPPEQPQAAAPARRRPRDPGAAGLHAGFTPARDRGASLPPLAGGSKSGRPGRAAPFVWGRPEAQDAPEQVGRTALCSTIGRPL